MFICHIKIENFRLIVIPIHRNIIIQFLNTDNKNNN